MYKHPILQIGHHFFEKYDNLLIMYSLKLDTFFSYLKIHKSTKIVLLFSLCTYLKEWQYHMVFFSEVNFIVLHTICYSHFMNAFFLRICRLYTVKYYFYITVFPGVPAAPGMPCQGEDRK